MNTSLKGKIALVTGVGRKAGIGMALCRELARNGADVFCTYWSPYARESHPDEADDPATIAEELRSFGTRIESIELDLSLPHAPEQLFTTIEQEMGSPHILINNAAYDVEVPFTELSPDVLDTHYAVNVRAVTMLCKEFVKRGNPGSIINMTSGQALGSMGAHKIPYTITKAALEMLAPQLAPELSKLNITINALDPGPTDTGWMSEEMKEQIKKESKKGRVTTPEDIGMLLISVLTAETPVTGQVIRAER